MWHLVEAARYGRVSYYLESFTLSIIIPSRMRMSALRLRRSWSTEGQSGLNDVTQEIPIGYIPLLDLGVRPSRPGGMASVDGLPEVGAAS